jgi:tetratricopeptide (TPR) repeat protein
LNCLAGVLAALLLAVLFRGTRAGTPSDGFWPALLGGLVFALHPTHVESVAFICGRTDLMLAVFLLAAFLLLVRFRDRPRAASGLAIVAAFGLGLLCKEAAILFPVLALIYLLPFARRRGTRVLLGTMLAVAVLYLIARSMVIAGAKSTWGSETAAQRFMLVVNAFGRYAFLSVVPFFHRLLFADTAGFAAAGWPTVVGVAAAVAAVWLGVKYRKTPLGLGSAWFVLFVVPGSNVFSIGGTYLAERLLYLPTLGVIMVAAAGALAPARRRAVGPAMAVAVVVYSLAMGVNTLRRMPIWKDNARLYAVMANEAPESPQAHYNLGTVLDKAGNDRGAIVEYRKAIALVPTFPEAHNNLGTVLQRVGDLAGAIAEYQQALAADSGSANAHYNLAGALKKDGDVAGAIRECRRALQLDPHLATARRNLAQTLEEAGDLAGAIEEYRRGIALEPNDATWLYHLAGVLHEAGDLEGSMAEYRRALALRPDMAHAHNDLAIVLQESGDTAGAVAEFREAVRLQPGDALAHANLGSMLRKVGDLDGAAAEYRRALELAPGLAPVRQSLQEVLALKAGARGSEP